MSQQRRWTAKLPTNSEHAKLFLETTFRYQKSTKKVAPKKDDYQIRIVDLATLERKVSALTL